MPFQIVTVPCRTDNYAYIVKGEGEGEVCVIDAPEAEPIIKALDDRGWSLGAILLTHHHNDHTAGVAALRDRYGCKVVGPAAEAGKLPQLDRAVQDGDTGGDGAFRSVVIAVPGHTLGHVAYHFPGMKAVFTADSLMSFGCGRVFEGSHDQMWTSLSRLAELPPDTQVYSGHEYTAGNARFALTVEPDNPAVRARATAAFAAAEAGRPTVPSSLSEELATNPFLRARLPEIKTALGMGGKDDAAVFAEIRRRKDAF